MVGGLGVRVGIRLVSRLGIGQGAELQVLVIQPCPVYREVAFGGYWQIVCWFAGLGVAVARPSPFQGGLEVVVVEALDFTDLGAGPWAKPLDEVLGRSPLVKPVLTVAIFW